MIPAIIAFWYMLVGHFLADYPLQTEFITTHKNPLHQGRVPWYYVMMSHATLHGAFVSMATATAIGQLHILFPLILGLYEVCLHYFLDVLKCVGCTSIHTDQLLHIMCKVAWAVGILLWLNDCVAWGWASSSLFAFFVGTIIFAIAYKQTYHGTTKCKT